jgi:signal transduction histidine kinase
MKAEVRDDYPRIAVEDNGTGYTKEFQERVFGIVPQECCLA